MKGPKHQIHRGRSLPQQTGPKVQTVQVQPSTEGLRNCTGTSVLSENWSTRVLMGQTIKSGWDYQSRSSGTSSSRPTNSCRRTNQTMRLTRRRKEPKCQLTARQGWNIEEGLVWKVKSKVVPVVTGSSCAVTLKLWEWLQHLSIKNGSLRKGWPKIKTHLKSPTDSIGVCKWVHAQGSKCTVWKRQLQSFFWACNTRFIIIGTAIII